MRLVGYWIETVEENGYFPPQLFVGELASGDRQALVDYLEGGDIYQEYRGLSRCRFCGADNGFREFSDGCWVWPEGLAHYVHEHGVVLPEAFLEHVKMGKARIPKEYWVKGAPDVTFWKEWCGLRVGPRYFEQLAQARAKADRDAEEQFLLAVKSKEEQEGIEEKRCLTSGCGRRVLAGRWVCATCALGPERDMYRKMAYSNAARLLGV